MGYSSLLKMFTGSESPVTKKSWTPLDVDALKSVRLDMDSESDADYPVPVSEMTSVVSHYAQGSVLEDIKIGPTVVTYLFSLPIGFNGSSLVKREEDLGRDLSVLNLRVVPQVPGTSYMGVEVPNNAPYSVSFKDVFSELTSDSPLEIALGRDTLGQLIPLDLAKMPHLLVSGTTGSGKSVFLNSVICSLVARNSPSEVELLLVDPKQVEFDIYRDLGHLRLPIANDPFEASECLDSAIEAMEERLDLFRASGVRSLADYNHLREANGMTKLPYIVAIIDEFADLMMMDKSLSKSFETKVVRIAQKARAAGIHLIVATQKPIVKVVTSLIKGNLPSRISFRVPTANDSRVILDSNGAENLMGKGDMLIASTEHDMKRAQGAWLDDDDIRTILSYAEGQ
jgi:S-DNA-T family DNA segregation ATPase FtsK/SpoIIIE